MRNRCCRHLPSRSRRRRRLPRVSNLVIGLLTLLVASCAFPLAAPTPTPTLTPSPTFTPSPTPTPTPTPTATPIPPLQLELHWPDRVSALEPVPIKVELIPPPGIGVTATVAAQVSDPAGITRWESTLAPQPQGHTYVATRPLQLPLEPLTGDWHLKVDVKSTLAVEGAQTLIFQPDRIPLRDLTNELPPGASIRIPQAFLEAERYGDQTAGGRVWRHGDGEIGLWWAPGPAEPLLLNNAIVMLETTHDADRPPQVLGSEETTWQEWTAFRFRESWPGDKGGPAEALVVQAPDYRLYVLRIRALGGEAIPPLLHQIRETFTLSEQEE